MQMEFFYNTKLWVIFIGLIVFFSAVSLLSHYIAGKKDRAEPGSTEFLSTTILGLLALLLGFTFSMAISRFDTRSSLVLKESNTIGTAYLRSDLFPQDQVQEYRRLLKEYTQQRIEFFTSIRNGKREFIQNMQALQTKIWQETTKLVKNNMSPVAATFIQANNDLIDVDGERLFASENHVPEVVFDVLILIAAMGLASLSYSLGIKKHSAKAPLVLGILFAVVIVLIQDLDRPGRGLIQPHEDAMIRVLESM
ncbi:hypothetical protein AZI87_02955 [Bdellovibrio bacteriovorus]|uniref:DUF4239 domain-containing protein n=2 Tax=Pseudobdellovibrionaceae TaxID=213483 RepID=A0A162GIH3_BDEBC|nr:hypothetical protein AZI87_02955 [Bdellovibrio bacteriovorus]